MSVGCVVCVRNSPQRDSLFASPSLPHLFLILEPPLPHRPPPPPPLSLLFHLIFVARRCHPPRAPLCNRGTMYWAPFVVERSTRSVRSKGVGKDRGGPIKTTLRLTATAVAPEMGLARGRAGRGPNTRAPKRSLRDGARNLLPLSRESSKPSYRFAILQSFNVF